MTNTVFTMGYMGRQPDEIAAIAAQRNAVVFDIRYSPRSANPMFSGKRLQVVLGKRYRHIRALGNQNYKMGQAGQIQIEDYDAGKGEIVASSQPVILLCACKDYHTCHRAVVAEQLRRDGYEVEEIPLPAQPPKAVRQAAMVGDDLVTVLPDKPAESPRMFSERDVLQMGVKANPKQAFDNLPPVLEPPREDKPKVEQLSLF